MKKIKFSNQYTKLNRAFFIGRNREARLLQAIKIHHNDLSGDMITYDTEYFNPTRKFYDLPRTDLIFLVFQSRTLMRLFTTIRRYTPSKWKYYKKAEGELFEVVIN